MNPDIFQIFYSKEQLPHLDSAFRPFDNSESKESHLYEYGVLRNHYLAGRHLGGYSGYVSWKFKQKSGISGQDFRSWISQKPGYDLYFINPFPLEIRFSSVWQQGEAFHPGIIRLADKVIKKVHPQIDIAKMTNSPKEFSFCNYWVGNEKFWEAYMKFTLPIFDELTQGLNEADSELLWAPADRKTKSPLFPFITERLLSTILANQPDFKWTSYSPSLPLLMSKTTRSRALKTWVQYHLNSKTRNCALPQVQRQRQIAQNGDR